MKSQQGIYAVEFAIVGSIFMLLMLAIIEMGRLYFTYNALYEVSRRAARLAVVCQVDDIDLTTMARFDGVNIVPNLTDNNVIISYHKADGSTAIGTDIDLIRARVVNYQHQFLVPGLAVTLNFSDFITVLPRESLGVFKVDEAAGAGAGFTDCS